MQNSIPIPLHANPDDLVRIALIAMIGENGERLPHRWVWPESLRDGGARLRKKHP